ncbi:hypothetical protein F3N43_13250 [Alkalilimnicola sp. S0819]|nr:hypothetical protein F3N43_13250 [Alkalilimnicola sp. S0819]MPQ17601.1 hypothetical protein [Alkalilimnicola sp. S0819]
MFVESASFALGAAAGGMTAKAGSMALGLLVMATPIGWVGLLVGGAVVVGATATTTIVVNGKVRDGAGSWYDAIMRGVRELWN